MALEYCYLATQQPREVTGEINGLVCLLATCESPLSVILRCDGFPCIKTVVPSFLLQFLTYIVVLVLVGIQWIPTFILQTLQWVVIRTGLLAPYPVYWVLCHLGIMEFTTRFATAKKFFTHLGSMDLNSCIGFLLAAQRHSALHFLCDLHFPTLVVHAGKDLMVPVTHAEQLVDGIKQSEVVTLPTASHMGLSGHAPTIAQHIDEFLSKHRLLC